MRTWPNRRLVRVQVTAWIKPDLSRCDQLGQRHRGWRSHGRDLDERPQCALIRRGRETALRSARSGHARDNFRRPSPRLLRRAGVLPKENVLVLSCSPDSHGPYFAQTNNNECAVLALDGQGEATKLLKALDRKR